MLIFCSDVAGLKIHFYINKGILSEKVEAKIAKKFKTK